MRAMISIAAASALALVTVSAAAQQPSPPGGPATPPMTGPQGGAPGAAPAAIPKMPAPDPLTMEDVSKIKGADVYGSDNKKIGAVSTVLMKPDSKTIDRLVVGSGGILGVGGHHVAIPLDDFSWDSERSGFKIAKTTDDLKSMPEWKEPASATTASGSTQPAPGAAPAAGSGSSSSR